MNQTTNVIRSAGTAMLVSVAIVLLGGCRGAVAGHWELLRAVPNPETFAIDDADFEKDGTYTATLTFEGRTVRQSGNYDFNGYKLRLRPNAGGEHAMDAALKINRLELNNGQYKAILKKVRRPPESEPAVKPDAAEPEAIQPVERG